jgi:hypothetical protein
LFSVVLGVGTWLVFNFLAPETLVPANLLGLMASIVGMLLGSLAPTVIASRGQSLASALGHAGQDSASR